jgi:esterase/lipase
LFPKVDGCHSAVDEAVSGARAGYSRKPVDRPRLEGQTIGDFSRSLEDIQVATLELVRFPAEEGVDLDSLLFRPARPTRKLLILVPGLSGPVLGGRHDYRPLAERLEEQGFALFLINMRSANTFWYSRFDDCATDIAGALRHVKSLGFDRIALFGTSLGGPRVAYTLSRIDEPAIKLVGFLASIKSPYLEAQLRMDAGLRGKLDACLEHCRDLVAQGRGHEGVTFLDWFPERPLTMMARSFISYFGTLAESNASTVKFGAHVKVPALVIHGTADEIALAENAQAIYDSLTHAPHKDLIWVEGAVHYLRSGWIAETYAQRIAEWVGRHMPAD